MISRHALLTSLVNEAKHFFEFVADKVLREKVILLRELREALGRTVFVYSALGYDRPLLAPLFAFLNTGEPGACVPIPTYVFLVISWLRGKLLKRRRHPCCVEVEQRGSLMRVDAHATDTRGARARRTGRQDQTEHGQEFCNHKLDPVALPEHTGNNMNIVK